MTREELRNALLKKDNKFATNYIVVANTYMNISYDFMTHKLNMLNAIVNKKLFRYYIKYPDKRVQFAYNHQRVENNTHSHLILKIPDEYILPHTEYLKLRDLMWFSWWQLDDRHNRKFRLWFQKVDDEPTSKFFNVKYAVRQTKEDTAQNNESLETIGAVNVGQCPVIRASPDGQRIHKPTIWIVRNKDKWKSQTLEAIGDHWANDPLNAGIDIFGGVDSKNIKEDK